MQEFLLAFLAFVCVLGGSVLTYARTSFDVAGRALHSGALLNFPSGITNFDVASLSCPSFSSRFLVGGANT